MTPTPTAARARRRTAGWVSLAVLTVVGVAALTAYLTAPRPGGPMDPASTSPDGAHALVSLLRGHGVDVVAADDIEQVARSATADTLVVIAQTGFLTGADQLRRLAALPGDRLVVEPDAPMREALAPAVRLAGGTDFGADPGCDLPAATRAGSIRFDASHTYKSAGATALIRCYDGALVRYTDSGRTVTVLGTAEVLANSKLLDEGNAALAMNLVGARSRVVWYAPQHRLPGTPGGTTIFDLIPDNVTWILWQLWLAVALVAVWKGRRIGPLVAERLPVVVRASETVEGRGRLYRSTRSRDRAADALRTATLHRLLPRLGLGPNATPAAVVHTVAQRSRIDPAAVGAALFGPAPGTEADLVNLAHHLDDIERQVTQS